MTTVSVTVTVTVLAFDYALGAAIMGINDLLYLANSNFNRSESEKPEKHFKIQIASWDGVPVKTLNNVLITPHCSIQSIKHSDVYLVPTIAGDIEKTLLKNPNIVKTLKQAGKSGCLIGSNSTGSFFLAEAGLLDDKLATTHWGFIELFKQRYPKVKLDTTQLLTHDGNLLCDGGGLAWLDLGLYLVELFCNHETAVKTSKFFVIDMGRTTQLTYSPLISKKYHNDKTILTIQNWMEDNFQTGIVIDQIGKAFGLSHRSLIRRFKSATNSTPSGYLQEIRLDAAIRFLIQSNKTIDEITHAVGYEDISSFTRLFKRKTGLTPSNYRARNQPIHLQR